MLRAPLRTALPGLAHFDGTVRLQTVAAADDAWLHALLAAVQISSGGHGVLAAGRFASKGPLLNRLETALRALHERPDLTHVAVDVAVNGSNDDVVLFARDYVVGAGAHGRAICKI
jgi:hypothetical protein